MSDNCSVRTTSIRSLAVVLLLTGLFGACEKKEETPPVPASGSTPRAALFTRRNYAPPPPVRTYPSPAAVIDGWIAAVDTVKIRAHGWDVWESITSPSGVDGLPVWETWYSGSDLFDTPSSAAFTSLKASRDFERPSQFHHRALGLTAGRIPRDRSEEVTSFNRYTRPVAEFIWNHAYNNLDTLTAINTTFNTNGTPIVQRAISTSSDSVNAGSIVLKPVFQFIRGDTATAIPYWDGITPGTTSDSANPTVATWKQGVVVDPTGKLKVGSMVNWSVNGGAPVPCKVVALSDFYSITLDSADAAAYSQFAETSGDDVGRADSTDSASVAAMVKPGSIALLTAMHVTTKENVNWTWQTFYWTANPDAAPYGNDRPKSIKGPWSHYDMHVAYFMVIPPGTAGGAPYVSYNPYLETNLEGSYTYNGDTVRWTGIGSNCMSCHRMAAIGGNGTPYVPNGQINPADSQFFAGTTKTDFLWSIPTRAH